MSGHALWPLRRHEMPAVLGSALLFVLSFPPFPLPGPALVCLVPVAVAVARISDDAEEARAAARLGFWFGLIAYAVGISWMAVALLHFTSLALFGYLAAILAAAMLVAAATTTLFAVRRVTGWPMFVLLPVVWVAFETMIAHLPEVAFPWLPLGLSAAQWPVLAQLADLSGVRGLSFVLAAGNGILADAWVARREPRAAAWRVATAAALIAGMVGYGVWRIGSIPSRPLMRIAIVQPNIAQERKWVTANREVILGELTRLTRSIPEQSGGRAALVVWPEAALTDWIQLHPEWLDTVAVLVRQVDSPLLFGALWREPRVRGSGYDRYNAALITGSDGRVTQPPYLKRDLVPLIERTPFIAPRLLAGTPYFGGYSRGTATMLRHPEASIGTLICFESVFPENARELRRLGADVLVSITNDAWFGRSLAPWQHEAHLAIRAIETRVGIVRAANTGFSGFVDPLGRISGRTRLFERAVRIGTVETTSIVSPFMRFGDWAGALSAGGTLLGLAAVGLRRSQPASSRTRRTPGFGSTPLHAECRRRPS